MFDPAVIGKNFWSSDAPNVSQRPTLAGDLTVDVAILGGGFSGLWTAYYLLLAQPDLDVAVVEQSHCGFGASGRNGGWCSPRYPIQLPKLIERYGAATARQTQAALYATCEEIARVCEREKIDANFRQNGILALARGEAQLEQLRTTYKAYLGLGFSSENAFLDAARSSDVVKVEGVQGALRTRVGGTLHPGKLVHGLAAAVERLGGVIFENTQVLDVAQGRLTTPNGVVVAKRAVVLAAEAYGAQLPNRRRSILPVTSAVLVTQPLSQALWAEIGWDEGEGLSCQAQSSHYLTKTSDGRILFGGHGTAYQYGSQMSETALGEPSVFEGLEQSLFEWFPKLRGVLIDYAWSGYLGMPRDGSPTVSYNRETKAACLFGYTGRGLATSNLAARLLAGLILDRESGLEALPMQRSSAPNWEGEPLRWLGVRYVEDAFSRIDRAEKDRRGAPLDAWLAKALAGD